MKEEKKKEYGRGGKRENSGRKRKFQDHTTINFKAEKEDVQAAKNKYGKELNKTFLEWLKFISK